MAWKNTDGKKPPLVSHTGVVLSRPTTFRFELDPTDALEQRLWMFAGARRFAFNHHIGRVKANLETRQGEKAAGLGRSEMTPSLSWSKQSFINEFNAWKNGTAVDSPVNDDGTRGLRWRDEIAADVFECASVDAAQALANYKQSVSGARAGVKVGFPDFKAKHSDRPRFRLRSKSPPGETAPVRFIDSTHLRLPKLGEVRVKGCARKVSRMLAAGRFHIHSATVTYRAGRWYVALNGVAGEFHHQRRTHTRRHQADVGADRGLKTLMIAADANGLPFAEWEGVKALRRAELQLKRANQALSRTKKGSAGRAKARARLAKIHARIARQRSHIVHQASHDLATLARVVCIEDLNIAGMTRNRSLAKSVADAAMGELGRRLGYKANWYGAELHLADRWYASSKTCSGCGHVKDTLYLHERIYVCGDCGLEIDRDLNAAINLARWPTRQEQPPTPLERAA